MIMEQQQAGSGGSGSGGGSAPKKSRPSPEQKQQLQRPNSGLEMDVKPLITPNPSHVTNGLGAQPSQPSTSKWLPGTWQDANRKSAFQPYKQAAQATVLTNLQRGNTKAETPVPQQEDINFFTRAGKGELSDADIKKEADINSVDESGLTALHWAASYGQQNTVKLLLANGAEVDKTGPDGETPLIFAAAGGHHDIIRMLIEKGANVNHCDDVGNTALMFAASLNFPHSVNELIIHKADITMTNMNGDTAYNLSADHKANLAQAVIENYILSLANN